MDAQWLGLALLPRRSSLDNRRFLTHQKSEHNQYFRHLARYKHRLERHLKMHCHGLGFFKDAWTNVLTMHMNNTLSVFLRHFQRITTSKGDVTCVE